jgi:hypothetical protein
LITGVPGHYITNLTLENIEIELAGGGTAENARQLVPEAIDQYPEVKTFGPRVPAYGVWARHVKGLKLKNVKFNLKNNDVRPAFVCEDGKDIQMDNWKLSQTNGAQAIVRLENVDGADIKKIEASGNADALVRVEGGDSKTVKVSNTKTPGIKKQVEVTGPTRVVSIN